MCFLTIKLTINGAVQFSYESHMPVVGTHVGLFVQDADVDIASFVVSIGSQNIMVNCLSVPDAFFASHEYDRALSEYRRIGASFTGRAEGRDALFRAGITILEKAQRTEESAAREALFDLARHEFQKLRHTPGAPLEYLGKALAYQHSGEYDEEVKCLELAFRRYKNHPLLRVLVEHVVLRMHESSRQDRVAAYQFICFVLRFLPDVAAKPSSQKLLHSLNSNWEVPPFFLSNADEGEPINRQHHFCLILAFWLEKSYVASEIFEELIATPVLPISHIVDCLLLFIALGQFDLLRDGLSRWRQLLCEEERTKYAPLFRLLSLFFLDGKDSFFDEAKACLQKPSESGLETRILLILIERNILLCRYDEALALYELKTATTPFLEEILASRALEALLATRQIAKAEALASLFPSERLCSESCPLFFFYGCLLHVTRGSSAALRHFELCGDLPYPRTWALAAHVIVGRLLLKGWLQRSFRFERRILVRQLRLYGELTGSDSFASSIELLINEG